MAASARCGEASGTIIPSQSKSPSSEGVSKALVRWTLLREVKVAVSIKPHPNLVTVYGVCDGADGELQLVLEYCEDGSLLQPEWLRRLDKVCAAYSECARVAAPCVSCWNLKALKAAQSTAWCADARVCAVMWSGADHCITGA